MGIAMSSTTDIDKEDPWTLIGSYFDKEHLHQLVSHQIESYNDFVQVQLPKTISMFNPVHIKSDHDYVKETNKYRLELFITFDTLGIQRPQIHENNGATKLMFPHEARLRNFTYTSNMTLNMHIKYIVRQGKDLENEQIFYKTLPNIHIGKLPILLRSSICVLKQYKHVSPENSGECYMDPGGYFIINGSEKTCLGQERAAENNIQCFNISKNNSKWSWIAEIKSVPDNKCISPKQIALFIATKNNGFGHGISLQIPRIKIPIPLFIVFRSLGIITDKDICKHIVLDPDNKSSKIKKILFALRGSIVEASQYLSQEEALKYITSQAMFTPLNMDKETGIKKKKNLH